MVSFPRLELILLTVLANAVTFVSTIVYKWRLLEVAIVYYWEFVVIALLTLIVIRIARTIDASRTLKQITPFQIIKTKVIAFLVAFLMYGLFLRGYLYVLYYLCKDGELDAGTNRAIFICVLLFFIAQVSACYKESQSGFYVELISDNQIATPFSRSLPMYIMLPLLALKFGRGINYTFVQFIIAFSAIAIIDASKHVVHLDQCKKCIEKVNTTG